MSFKIVRNDIVNMETQAIVNTANEYPEVGNGCDYGIYTAAGYDELLAYRKEKIGQVPEGEVFITPGFNLKAEYIIHAVSPFYEDGNKNEEEKLRSCYRKSLALAKEHGIKSISFPLISTGSFGYPKEEGMRIAVDEIYDFLFDNDMDIYLVVFDTRATILGEKIYPDLEDHISHNYAKEIHEDDLKRKLKYKEAHLADTFSEYLLYLISSKGMTNAEVYKRAIIDKKLFAKIKNDPKYHPQKITCMCLCVGARLNIDETRDLLARAGYALSPCDMRDVIFKYFIEREHFDMVDIDIQLEEFGIPCVIF